MARHEDEVLLRLIQKLEAKVENLEKRVKDLEQAPKTYRPILGPSPYDASVRRLPRGFRP